MTRPVNSRVRHGMPTCGEYGCARAECVAAMRKSRTRRRRLERQGIYQHVPAGPTRRHIEKLVLAGMSVMEVSALSGIAHTTISLVRREVSDTVLRTTADALLGVAVPLQRAGSGLTSWPAVGTMRRLQALAIRGFTLPAIAEELGCSRRRIFMIRSGGRARVRVETHLAVLALYNRWWNADPTEFGVPRDRAAACISNALAHGWASSGHWDEEAIDDPSGFPDWTGACGTAKGYRLHLSCPDVPPPCPPCTNAVPEAQRLLLAGQLEKEVAAA
ncbi:hypothetical protein KCMC57_64730 (plasmid) [Kitasatospora sp. CMC57]|uniref:Helix-turn-helix domain-containing protein n=1 Tax=Kitasatospora sp. CMC57 TaxID=3231513 RepID=A0AB33K7D7_9ACTN